MYLDFHSEDVSLRQCPNSRADYVGNRKTLGWNPFLSFPILKACNFKCVYCGVGGEATASLNRATSLQTVKAITQKAISHGITKFRVTGGEPFLHPEIIEILNYFSELGYYTLVNTNGSLIVNLLNGGRAHAAHLLREALLNQIEQYMEKCGIHREYTPITTAYRGTSIASPLRAEGVYTGHRFIKITHELGLKIACYAMLQSVYEIGYVCRDRYETQSNLNEFLTIEGVATLNTDFCLCDFYYETWGKTIEIAERLKIEVNDDFKDIVIVDFVKEYGSVPKKKDVAICMDLYDKLVLEHKHLIMTNAPTTSPLVYSEADNLPLETKWIYKGKGIGHGYKDEYRVEKVYKSFEEQREILRAKKIECDLPMDYLEILSSSGFPTQSFVIGIERLISNIVDNNKIRG